MQKIIRFLRKIVNNFDILNPRIITGLRTELPKFNGKITFDVLKNISDEEIQGKLPENLALRLYISGKIRALRVYLPYLLLRWKVALKLPVRLFKQYFKNFYL